MTRVHAQKSVIHVFLNQTLTRSTNCHGRLVIDERRMTMKGTGLPTLNFVADVCSPPLPSGKLVVYWEPPSGDYRFVSGLTLTSSSSVLSGMCEILVNTIKLYLFKEGRKKRTSFLLLEKYAYLSCNNVVLRLTCWRKLRWEFVRSDDIRRNNQGNNRRRRGAMTTCFAHKKALYQRCTERIDKQTRQAGRQTKIVCF